MLAGSIGPGGRCRNIGLLIDSVVRIAARYDKLHLFEIGLAGQPSYCEAADWRRCVVVHHPAEAVHRRPALIVSPAGAIVAAVAGVVACPGTLAALPPRGSRPVISRAPRWKVR